MRKQNAIVESLERRTLLSTWTTVDNFQLAPGHAMPGVQAMAADKQGNTYAIGYAANASNVYVGIVRESSNAGATWNTVQYSYGPGATTQFLAGTVGPDGSLYVAGDGYDSQGREHWLILKTSNGGPLTVVDDFLASAAAEPHAITTDAAGDVFAAGLTEYASGSGARYTLTGYWTVRRMLAGQTAFTTVDNFTSATSFPSATAIATIAGGPGAGVYAAGYSGQTWVVRKSTTNGTSWSTVDNFQYATSYQSRPNGIVGDLAGNVYVAGYGIAPSPYRRAGSAHWLVRESSNGGASWSINDDFQYAAGWPSLATAVGTDAGGNLYVIGQANDGKTLHALARTNVGGTWTTIDDYQLAPGQPSGYSAFAVDSAGDLFAGGQAYDSSGNAHWFVRSSPGPATPMATTTSAAVTADPLFSDSLIEPTHSRRRPRGK